MDELREILVAEVGIEVESELRKFYGNFRGNSGGADAIVEFEEMARDLRSFVAVGNIFTQMRQHGLNAVRGERARGGDGVLHVFARQETSRGAAHESEAGSVFAHPLILRDCQNSAAHQIHDWLIVNSFFERPIGGLVPIALQLTVIAKMRAL